MRCYRIDLRRKYLLFLEGRLTDTRKIEDHLLNCASCRAYLERLNQGVKKAKNLERIAMPNDLWPKFATRLSTTLIQPQFRFRTLATTTAIGMIALVVLVLFTFWKRSDSFESKLNLNEYHAVPIDRMASNDEPHVVTEGYVSELRIDDEDGDMVFKLVKDLRRPNPFVICEVIDGLRMPLPSVGSRVRVYGVSRYDAKIDHEWHEVHPVLNIQVLHP